MQSLAPFVPGPWQDAIDVRDFIQKNYKPYMGDARFLQGPTESTLKLWNEVLTLMKEEQRKGILDAETKVPAGILAHGPAWLDKQQEMVVGFQTDKPLKRSIMPQGGSRTVSQALESYGYHLDGETQTIYSKYRKTHNQGVFDVYSRDMRAVRSSGIITGLPDSYGRGRIIGDYRRVALYGVDRLILDKKNALKATEDLTMDEDLIRLREETAEQINALNELKAMAKLYGFDISEGAKNGREAIQWLYFAYLAAVKEQDGAAMSLGRVSTFLDIFLERDIESGYMTEREAQELIDHFVMKLRMVRFLRTPDYNELFSGDPTWITEAIGGIGTDGRPLVTKSSFRFLHTLRNLGPAPEPNLTVLWSVKLPEAFKDFCALISAETSAIQYENDDLMRDIYGDDYGIACCVSAMRIGKQMQFFGARANLAKALLYAINGGRDEKTGEQIAPRTEPVRTEYLDYEDVWQRLDATLDWLAKTYMNALNVIHYMHDKYNYERLEMALHDQEILRTMACGIAGLSVVTDSLSAIRHAKVKVIRNADGLITDYETEGEFPVYGNNDERADQIAVELVEHFMEKLRQQKTYRNALPTQSVLTITSNVVYGKKTGNTPDGRKAGIPFAPGANPMHGRDKQGAVSALASVAKLPYRDSMDGISYTFSIVPNALGHEAQEARRNLVNLMDGFTRAGGHHINVNVLHREKLIEAMDHPERYPQLTIRVSGYAVNFIKLTRDQQLDVINRTFHGSMHGQAR